MAKKEEQKTKKKENKNQEEFEQQLKQKYMEYQMIEEQTKKMQEQLETFEKQISELGEIKDAVTSLQKTKAGTELLVPMSSGIFIKAQVQDIKKVLVNVGDNVVVEKDIKDAVSLIEKQQTEIESYKAKVMENTQMLMLHSQKIEQEVLEMAQQVEQ